MRIDGEKLDIGPGDIDTIEEVLSRKGNMWMKYTKIAREQFPEYDKEKHILSYDWISRQMTVKLKKRR